MKILHINFSKEGGAAIGVKRFHEALKDRGIRSEIFYFSEYLKKNSINSLNTLIKWKIQVYLKKIIFKFFTNINSKESHSLNYFSVLKIKDILSEKKPDILHLHWIGNEMISIKDISKIDIPLVWTFHDMWPFCGGEHFTENNRFRSSYNKLSRSKYESGIDINKLLWEKKFKLLSNKKINIVCPSNWIKKKLDRDKIFKRNIKIISPYIIDKNKWEVKIKKGKNDREKKIKIVFIATSSVNYRKGFPYLYKAIEKYLDKDKYELVCVGDKPKFFDSITIEKKYLGYISNYKQIKKIYSSSDILVMPSLMESFGQIYIEAGICGLPCVAFKNTAAEDIVKHKFNGYLAKFKSSKDLANGIEWCRSQFLSSLEKKKIKKMTIKNFSNTKINNLVKLYKKIENKNF